MLLRKAINLTIVLFVWILIHCSELVVAFSFDQIELHHIFPQPYAGWFLQREIDPDLYCIQLTRQKHTGKEVSIHHHKYVVSGGLNYNDSWENFINLNPNATFDQSFEYAGALLSEYGLNIAYQKYYNYKTKQPSNSKIPAKIKTPKPTKFTKFLKYISKSNNIILKSITKKFPLFNMALQIGDFNSYNNESDKYKSYEVILESLYEDIITSLGDEIDDETNLKINNAISIYLEIYKEIPDWPKVSLMLGDLYYLNGNEIECKRYWSNASSLYYNSGDLEMFRITQSALDTL